MENKPDEDGHIFLRRKHTGSTTDINKTKMDKAIESARQFLKQNFYASSDPRESDSYNVAMLMASHASNEAQHFNQWTLDNCEPLYAVGEIIGKNKWEYKGQSYTVAELYSKYQEEKQL